VVQYIFSFDPTIGVEIKKTRPAVIISNDVANQYSPIVIVAAITGRAEPKFDEVLIKPPEGGLAKPRSIDKRRLVKKLGELSKETVQALNTALQITLGLVKF